ncbi:MAG: nuclear transport factor 2 family protein [Acidimicrobiia bacterium]|nr:nuclear transport factor 2 family protein [Acidimicrobiia bacterium]
MSDHDATIRAFGQAWGRGDIDAILDAFTDDAVYHNMPMEPAEGKEAIRAFLESFLGVMAESITFEFHHQLVQGDLVMNERTDTLVMNGTEIALPVMGVFEMEGDKIRAWRDYFDAAQFTGG